MTKNNNSALIRRDNNSLARRIDPTEKRVTPAADVFETPEAFVLRVDMPGVDRDSIRVTADSARLEISGKAGTLHADTANVLFTEIVKKSYYRVFNLTSGLAADRVEAEFENGVLTVVIPKSEQRKTKTIPIR